MIEIEQKIVGMISSAGDSKAKAFEALKWFVRADMKMLKIVSRKLVNRILPLIRFRQNLLQQKCLEERTNRKLGY